MRKKSTSEKNCDEQNKNQQKKGKTTRVEEMWKREGAEQRRGTQESRERAKVKRRTRREMGNKRKNTQSPGENTVALHKMVHRACPGEAAIHACLASVFSGISFKNRTRFVCQRAWGLGLNTVRRASKTHLPATVAVSDRSTQSSWSTLFIHPHLHQHTITCNQVLYVRISVAHLQVSFCSSLIVDICLTKASAAFRTLTGPPRRYLSSFLCTLHGRPAERWHQ